MLKTKLKYIDQQSIIQLNGYLQSFIDIKSMPIYSSVDVRDSGFKVSIVDTNLFPAGFNNLDQTRASSISSQFDSIIQHKCPGVRKVLLVIENNTRNLFYLDNVYALQSYLSNAEYQVTIAANFDVQSDICKHQGFLKAISFSGHELTIHCVNRLLELYQDDSSLWDFILLNNDLMLGVPELLHSFELPILPQLQQGWHARLKSNHFEQVDQILYDCCQHFDFDPWFLSCYYDRVTDANIMEDETLQRLADSAANILYKTQQKYNDYSISEKPFVMIKANSGTYGMGVVPFESPESILTMNRKTKNKLFKGKNGLLLDDLIIQEGVPSKYQMTNSVAEPCLYFIGAEYAGGFLRQNTQKSERENLNSTGMSFTSFEEDEHLNLYMCLAHLALLAVVKEREQ